MNLFGLPDLYLCFADSPVSGKEPEKAPEPKWSDEAKTVSHLDETSFNIWLGSDKQHALIMFYAPWCGHCKKAKPDFAAVADEFSGDPTTFIAAVDCTNAGGTSNVKAADK